MTNALVEVVGILRRTHVTKIDDETELLHGWN
jgi:hypothetical protein